MGEKSHGTGPTAKSSKNPLLIVLSGPSGVGKDAVLDCLKKNSPDITFITTMTTRPHRASEKHLVHYNFVSLEEFQKLQANNELLESANVYGNWYGVPKEQIREALKRGKDVIVKVDVQGVANIKKVVPQALFIFLMPPSLEELADRLKQRRTESAESLATRLEKAKNEIAQASMCDYKVINYCDKIESAAAEVKAIIAAEKRRDKPRKIDIA
ncbi:MAG: guanylate kinase [Dehalococcoidales bacterium]|nr:guanylate kinase [Dehalococcoidales bacterium]